MCDLEKGLRRRHQLRLRGVELIIYNSIPHCSPGYHPDDFIFRTRIIHFCSPDVSGNDLPMDGPTFWSAIIVGGLLAAFMLYLTYLMIFDRNPEVDK